MNPPFPSGIQDSGPKELETSTKGLGGAKRTALLALLVGVLVFAVTSFADLVLLREHEPIRLTIEISDGISALVIGLLSYRLLVVQQQRREQLRQRVETIANMNHHVRNALQIISLSSYGKSQEEIAAIRESVNRIQWALRELLPKI